MGDRSAPTVVKLGGSHASSPYLRDWVRVLAASGGRAVVVPGGGPFADTVRAAQLEIGFDDRAAHHMALLAMEQYGCALASLDPRLVPAASATAIRRGLQRRQVPVWLPVRMALAAGELPCSWELTSDSLAAWLAARLRAKRLFLVKHAAWSLSTVHVRDIASRGIADPLFPRFLAASGTVAFLFGAADHGAAAAALRDGSAAGTPIGLD